MMAMRFSRFIIFIVGILLMISSYFVFQYHTYKKSLFTIGLVKYHLPLQFSMDGLATMTLHYYVDIKEYTQLVELPIDQANQEVKVRYFPHSPDKGSIYTVLDFWIINMLWLLLPIIIWTAAIYTFMTNSGKIEMRFEKRKK